MRLTSALARRWCWLLPSFAALLLSSGAWAGLAEWCAGSQSPTAAAALRGAAARGSGLQVRWRPQGEAQWSGRTGPWRPSPGGLSARAVGDGLFTAALAAEDLAGGVRFSLRLTATRAVAAPTEVLLSCPFEPPAWQRQLYPHLPYLQLPPEQPLQLRFAADAGDATPAAEVPEVAFYPFGVLESPE